MDEGNPTTYLLLPTAARTPGWVLFDELLRINSRLRLPEKLVSNIPRYLLVSELRLGNDRTLLLTAEVGLHLSVFTLLRFMTDRCVSGLIEHGLTLRRCSTWLASSCFYLLGTSLLNMLNTLPSGLSRVMNMLLSSGRSTGSTEKLRAS